MFHRGFNVTVKIFIGYEWTGTCPWNILYSLLLVSFSSCFVWYSINWKDNISYVFHDPLNVLNFIPMTFSIFFPLTYFFPFHPTPKLFPAPVSVISLFPHFAALFLFFSSFFVAVLTLYFFKQRIMYLFLLFLLSYKIISYSLLLLLLLAFEWKLFNEGRLENS